MNDQNTENRVEEVNYDNPDEWEDLSRHTRLFAPGHVEEWELAVWELRELLKKLEDPDFRDSHEMAELEESIHHDFEEIAQMFRLALDTKKKEGRP